MRGGLVTIGTVTALLAAMGLTVLGLGAADNAVANYDASSWLWSAARSEMARVNGETARVDTRVEIPQAKNHPMQVSQSDRMVILRDLTTGQVSSLDLATLQVVATTRTTPGLGVNVVLHESSAFVVDAVQGIVRQLDPRSLVPVGEPVRYPPGITGGAFDGKGQLWVAVPSEGTVSAVTAAALPSAPAAAGDANSGVSPKLIRTVAVTDPSHELLVSTLDDGVAVLDRTSSSLTAVRGETTNKVTLQLNAPAVLPARTNGNEIAVTVPDERRVHVVGADGTVRQFVVPGTGSLLRPAVAWAGRYYCADDASGTVYAFDGNGQLTDTVPPAKGPNGPMELEVRENHLFINSPNSSTARVVDDKHHIKTVDKYANDVLGGDPPAEPPPPPKKPPVGKPSAPRSVTATAGNAQARVSWQPAAANNSPITKYVIEGAGRTQEVGANQRSIEVTGLTNGETYQFAVHAVNAKGAGPARKSNPVMPTAEVPDPPASVTAQERPDGTVLVKWPAANAQGNKISKYSVTAVSAGANAPAGDSTGTELVVPAGALEYGTQYAFTVVTVNSRGAGSKASPVSNTVVPYAPPLAPPGLRATTVANQPGTISVAWGDAVANGRPVTKYVVNAAGRNLDVVGNSTTVSGLGNGKDVTVKVQAVNDAGPGAVATTTARTVALPSVTITGATTTASTIRVAMTVNDGGGQVSCSAGTAGHTASGSCSALTITGVLPGTTYTVTVTATNAAGSVTATRSATTPKVYGKAVCVNNTSSSDPEQRTWCNDPANAMGVHAGTSLSTTLIGRASNGQRLEAICKANGEGVNDYVYNPGKMGTSPNDATPIWIRVKFGGTQGYISFAWFNLEGYDVNSTGPLPNC